MYRDSLLIEAMIKEAAAMELLEEAELLKLAARERAERVIAIPPIAAVPGRRAALLGGLVGALGGLSAGLGTARPLLGAAIGIPAGALMGAGLGAITPRLTRWFYGVE